MGRDTNTSKIQIILQFILFVERIHRGAYSRLLQDVHGI